MGFRYGLRVSMAVLTLVLLHGLVAPSPASGFDWDPYSYFEIDYDVSFSDDEVDIGEAFDLVIWGHAECIEMLPFGIDEAKGVADFVARHKETGRTEMLRAGYSASIGPDPEFPSWEDDEYTVDERVTLTFPEGSSYGEYEVIAQLVQVVLEPGEPGEWDVTELIPESYHSVVVGEISCVPYTPLDTDFSADSGIAGHPLEGIAGGTEFQFTDESSGGMGPYSYEWDFNNDGTIDSTEENPSWTYGGADTYTVVLTLTDSSSPPLSDAETKTGYTTVYEALDTDFYADSGIAGHPLEGIARRTEFQFTDESSGGVGPYSYEWDFNSDAIIDSTEENPSWTYDDADTYTVALSVSDIVPGASSDTETKVRYITVYAHVEADFSANSGIPGHPLEGIAGATEFQFTDETSGGTPPYTSWSWYFGDGVGTSMLENPSYTYPDAGTYTIALTVTDSDIIYDSDTETKVSYITVYAPLEADLSADSGIVGHPTEGYAGVTDFAFINDSVGGIPPYSYEWDFDNDGTFDSTLENPSHTYSDTGICTVALTVTDSSPASETATKVGYITVHAPVEADFYADSGIAGHPLEGIIEETEFDFSNESSGGVGSCIYEWDFNSDAIIDSTEENPSWTYDDADTYTVALTVSDIVPGASSDMETKVDYITVYEPLDAEFSADSGVAGHPREGIAGVTEFQFTDETAGGIPPYAEWSWYFGDGVGSSTFQNPSCVYPDAGTYTVVLAVSDSLPGNDIETKTDYITVCGLGDANKDSIVNMADVTKVERIILALDPSTACADANQDCATNMADVTKIERIILGIGC